MLTVASSSHYAIREAGQIFERWAVKHRGFSREAGNPDHLQTVHHLRLEANGYHFDIPTIGIA